MAFIFGDSFDWYTANTDGNGYWDSSASWVIASGRFTGSQAVGNASSGSLLNYLTKSSTSNDTTHHIVCAFIQTTALFTGTLGTYLQLLDGSTGQCCVVFRSDGAILFTSGTPTGTVLATYSNAFASNIWNGFEFEITIDGAAGVFRVRKNGNTSNDFAVTGLNTRTSTNNYANKLQVGTNSTTGLGTTGSQRVDDLLWFNTTGAAPNTWVGDVRAAQLLPASDSSIQFSKSPNPYTQSSSSTTTQSQSANNVRLMPFVAGQTGTIGTIVLYANAGATANVKAAIYDNTGVSGAPGSVVGTSNALVNPVTGANTVTFGSPPSVTRGNTYYLAVDQDATVVWTAYPQNPTWTQVTTYASFPANPASASNGGSLNSPTYTINITPTSYTLVNEAQEDGTTSYVYDNTVGHADFYTVSTIPTTSTVTAVTTRGFLAKSDAGLRSAQVQLTSGDSLWPYVKLLASFDNNLTDKSAGARTLTASGTSFNTTNKEFGSASIDFSGSTTAVVSTPSTSDLAIGTSAFTIECWARVQGTWPSDAIGHVLISKWGAADDWFFGVDDHFSLGFVWYAGADFSHTTGGVTTPSDNNWHHYCVERDASSTLRIYVDGVVKGTWSSYTTSITNTGGTNLTIGNVDAAGTNNWPGQIDETRITIGTARYGGAFTPSNSAFPSATTVQSTALNLSTSFQWAFRTDTVDPNTGSAWTATNLNAVIIGPLVTS